MQVREGAKRLPFQAPRRRTDVHRHFALVQFPALSDVQGAAERSYVLECLRGDLVMAIEEWLVRSHHQPTWVAPNKNALMFELRPGSDPEHVEACLRDFLVEDDNAIFEASWTIRTLDPKTLAGLMDQLTLPRYACTPSCQDATEFHGGAATGRCPRCKQEVRVVGHVLSASLSPSNLYAAIQA